MSKREFKVGDFVSGEWYSPGDKKYFRVTGKIMPGLEGREDAIHVDGFMCAPKSIRRLVKKLRRRVWIHRDDVSDLDHARIKQSIPVMPDFWIPFIEVKKKQEGAK
jgi:hypothetical protein